jgi:hypothetical protein
LAVPAVTRIGLVMIVVSAALAVLVLLMTDGSGHHHEFGPGHAAHLLGIVGMVLVMAGVVAHGARPHLRRAAAKPGGLDPNAHR